MWINLHLEPHPNPYKLRLKNIHVVKLWYDLLLSIHQIDQNSIIRTHCSGQLDFISFTSYWLWGYSLAREKIIIVSSNFEQKIRRLAGGFYETHKKIKINVLNVSSISYSRQKGEPHKSIGSVTARLLESIIYFDCRTRIGVYVHCSSNDSNLKRINESWFGVYRNHRNKT